MKPVGGVLAMTTGFIMNEGQKNDFNSYIYTLSLDHFCVLIVKIQCWLRKICGAEKLLNNVFGNNVEQPSSWPDVSQTFIDQLRHLFIHNIA